MNRLIGADGYAAAGDVESDSGCPCERALTFKIETAATTTASAAVDYVCARLEGDVGLVDRPTWISSSTWLSRLKHDFAVSARVENLRAGMIIPVADVGAAARCGSCEVGERIAGLQGAGDGGRRGADAAIVGADGGGGDRAAAGDALIRDDVAVGSVDAAATAEVNTGAAGKCVDAAPAAEILRCRGGGDGGSAQGGAEDAHEERRICVGDLNLHRIAVAVDGGLRGDNMNLASAIGKTVEARIVESSRLSLQRVSVCTELRGTSKSGAICSGLHLTALITQVADIHG